MCIGYRKSRLHFQSRENRQCHVSVSGVTEPPGAPVKFLGVCGLPPPPPPVSTQTTPGFATGVCSGCPYSKIGLVRTVQSSLRLSCVPSISVPAKIRSVTPNSKWSSLFYVCTRKSGQSEQSCDCLPFIPLSDTLTYLVSLPCDVVFP